MTATALLALAVLAPARPVAPEVLRVYDLANESLVFTGAMLPAPDSFTVAPHGELELLVGAADPLPAPRSITVVGPAGTCVTTATEHVRVDVRRAADRTESPRVQWREAFRLAGCDLALGDGLWLWPPERIALVGAHPDARWRDVLDEGTMTCFERRAGRCRRSARTLARVTVDRTALLVLAAPNDSFSDGIAVVDTRARTRLRHDTDYARWRRPHDGW